MSVPGESSVPDESPERSLAFSAHKNCSRFYAGFETVGYANLASIPTSTVLVDVRSPAEVAVSRIPGSVLPHEFDSTSHATVLVVCTLGLRAGLWAGKLAQNGYKGDILVSEGILLHVLDGGSVVRLASDLDGEWTTVNELHVHDERFNRLPQGWLGFSFSKWRAVWEGMSWIPAIVKVLIS